MEEYINNLTEILALNGIKYLFGVSGGGSSLKLITELEKRGIKFYPVAHEGSGAIMAGAASSKGKTQSAAISIKGPGFANMVPGILLNFYENRPAITISESYGKDTPPYKAHKRLDHSKVINSIVKASVGADDKKILSDALILAEEEIPGPIHIDIASHKNTYLKKESFSFSSEEEIGNTIDLIKNSKKPALILGSVVLRALRDIDWNSLKIPVATTASAKGAINEESEFSAGIITGEAKDLSPDTSVLNQADLIVAIGLRNTEVVKPGESSAPLLIFDSISGTIHDGFNANEKIITKDIESAAQRILKELKIKEWGNDLILKMRDGVDKELFKSEWMPAYVFQFLNEKKQGNNLTLVLDTGIFCTVGETIFKASDTREFLGASNGRFMGTAIPTAIGFSIANPERNVICVAGDGGIRPYFPEIKLAVEENLPILFVLVSDGAYGTFSNKARVNNMSKRAYKIKNPSWFHAAEAIGCYSEEAKNTNQFEILFDKFIAGKKPMFIEMNFDPEKYSTMAENLR